jgi:hypothetical protein
MIAIQKIENGFVLNNVNYSFLNYDGMAYEILSESQVHIGTNDGVMFLDLSVSINNTLFNDINEFVNFLYS